MKLVALKNNIVVAIEQNGSIDLNVKHDTVMNAPDDAVVQLGWQYVKPPTPKSLLRWFYPSEPPKNLVLEPVLVYEDDGNGNAVLVATHEQTT